jgi:hypothetical protein
MTKLRKTIDPDCRIKHFKIHNSISSMILNILIFPGVDFRSEASGEASASILEEISFLKEI